MAAKPGDAFTPQAPPHHRYIVLTSPDDNGEVLIANLTTITESHPDQGCTLERADYPDFIVHPTTIRFNKAEMVPAEKIQESAGLRTNKPLSPATLRKIQRAAVKSPWLKGEFQKLIQEELKGDA